MPSESKAHTGLKFSYHIKFDLDYVDKNYDFFLVNTDEQIQPAQPSRIVQVNLLVRHIQINN